MRKCHGRSGGRSESSSRSCAFRLGARDSLMSDVELRTIAARAIAGRWAAVSERTARDIESELVAGRIARRVRRPR